MGHGIAELFSINGFNVTLMDAYPQALDKAKVRISASLGKLVEKGRITPEQADAAKSRITYSGDMQGSVYQADLVIEAVPESLELKKSVLKEASAHSQPGTIFASNTSNIRITDLAAALAQRERMIGMHFFNPPMVMKLVEVIPGIDTDPAVEGEIVELCGKLGRTPIRVMKDSPGFIVNRINAADTLFFCLLLDKKIVTPAEVDNYAKGQGLPMGPYELLDFVGVDIGADSLAYFSSILSPEYGKGTTFAKMVKEGLLGKKTGRGFYDWSSGKAEIPKVAPTDKVSIMDIFALEINEAVKLVEEGVATPEDIERGVVLGMNRPFGPISVAKDLSNAEAKAKLEELAARFDCKVFSPTRSISEGRMRDAIDGRMAPKEEVGRPAPTVSQPGASEAAVRLERLPGKVARVVLNRPRLNTINGEVLEGLERMVDELSSDPEVRVVVITGEGPVFCAGADLSQFFSNTFAFMEFARRGAHVMRRVSEMPKITIATLKGYALGGGLELALSCDVRVATENVEIGFPEVTRGLVPAWSGSMRLPRLLGISQASFLILTSERINGKRAFDIGLVNRLAEGDVDDYAVKYATGLASSQAPMAVKLGKTLLNKGAEAPADDVLEMEAMAAGLLFATEDLREGISAFLGKRTPEFKGK